MKSHVVPPGRGWFLPLSLFVMLLLSRAQTFAAPTVLYSTDFESGYNLNADLEGQLGWTGTGGGTFFDNGLVEDAYFLGAGTKAYIGFVPLAPGQTILYVWQTNLAPVPAAMPIVKFSVTMGIYNLNSPNRDCFRWSVFNSSGTHLFTLDFDNTSRAINYALQNDTSFTSTGRTYDNDTPYSLRITMDMANNKWSATLDNVLLVTNLAIAATGTPLTLGDVDALWVYRDPNAFRDDQSPSENVMVFDNYTITSEAAPPPPSPTLAARYDNGDVIIRLTGEAGRRYAIEAATNLAGTINWTPLRTNTATGGFFDFLDTTTPRPRHRFYRGRLVP